MAVADGESCHNSSIDDDLGPIPAEATPTRPKLDRSLVDPEVLPATQRLWTAGQSGHGIAAASSPAASSQCPPEQLVAAREVGSDDSDDGLPAASALDAALFDAASSVVTQDAGTASTSNDADDVSLEGSTDSGVDIDLHARVRALLSKSAACRRQTVQIRTDIDAEWKEKRHSQRPTTAAAVPVARSSVRPPSSRKSLLPDLDLSRGRSELAPRPLPTAVPGPYGQCASMQIGQMQKRAEARQRRREQQLKQKTEKAAAEAQRRRDEAREAKAAAAEEKKARQLAAVARRAARRRECEARDRRRAEKTAAKSPFAVHSKCVREPKALPPVRGPMATKTARPSDDAEQSAQERRRLEEEGERQKKEERRREEEERQKQEEVAMEEAAIAEYAEKALAETRGVAQEKLKERASTARTRSARFNRA